MYDPTSAEDQLDARTEDVLSSLGLERTGSLVPDAEWMERISARDLWDFLLVGAVAATDAGHLWCLVAEPTPDGSAIAAHLIDVRKAQD